MQNITFKAPEDVLLRLSTFAKAQDRSRGYLIRKAIDAYLEELEEEAEDLRIATERLHNYDPSKNISLKDIGQKYGLAD